MKNKIQALFSCLLLLVFMAASTGISVFVHTCDSSQKREVTVYPEFFKHSSSCCCVDEQTDQNLSSSSKETQLENPECCRNQQLLLKASFTGFPVTASHLIKISFFPVPLIDVPANPVLKDQEPLAKRLALLDPSPPSGKDLLYSIHQIRIPFPAC